jgi:hypothetical protein
MSSPLAIGALVILVLFFIAGCLGLWIKDKDRRG